jgi:hypothetical protein
LDADELGARGVVVVLVFVVLDYAVDGLGPPALQQHIQQKRKLLALKT